MLRMLNSLFRNGDGEANALLGFLCLLILTLENQQPIWKIAQVPRRENISASKSYLIAYKMAMRLQEWRESIQSF